MLSHLNKYWLLHLFVSLPVFLIIIYLVIPPRKPIFNADYSVMVLSSKGELLNAYLNSEEQWHLPPINNQIPDKLKTAAIVFEDENFYNHIGVDFSAIARAFFQNYKSGKIISGASTIPMQVARMSNPKKRNYINKFLEACFAIKISLHYSKDNLLKLYLDHAPYGGNVIGYQAASLKFFGKNADMLTWSEAATLAVLPNAPGLIYPTSTSDELMKKRNQLLAVLLDKEYINEQAYQLALLEPIPDRFLSFNSLSPHLSRHLKINNTDINVFNTTIDADIQKKCNNIALRYRNIYSTYGIHNLSILVSETNTGNVISYVGSPDFFDDENGGQVDGVISPRSSGSILKPFLYALCFDEGVITPESFIRDLPTYFDGFTPQNASREYNGVIKAKDALIQSLNIPAVRLLNSYGVHQFYYFLNEAGLTTLFRNSDDYGLPLILGGAEVSMWEMVSLFRGLANKGVFNENVVVKGQIPKKSNKLISSASCHLTLEILKDLKRPGSEYFWEKFSGSKQFSWKTGTSYGHKDAWAIGLNKEYTIAVWVGNFNGDSNKNISGASSAGPIMFDILQMLPHKEMNSWFELQPDDFKTISVCNLSGFRASDACPEKSDILVPYGMKPLKACEYHDFVYLSDDSNYQSCSRCWGLIGGNKKVATIYPPDVAYFLRSKGQYVESPQSHYPYCPAYKADNSLSIIYPNLGARLFLPRDFDGNIQEVICNVGYNGPGEKIYWYLDEYFIGTTEKEHKLAVKFREGWSTIKVIDEFGAEDSQKVFATKNE
jgi:penicillin-binding protein 1C